MIIEHIRQLNKAFIFYGLDILHIFPNFLFYEQKEENHIEEHKIKTHIWKILFQLGLINQGMTLFQMFPNLDR